MDVMSSLGIVCSVSIVCFASEEFAEHSMYFKAVVFLITEQVLLCLKFFIQYLLPGDPDWVEELAARNEYIRYAASVSCVSYSLLYTMLPPCIVCCLAYVS